jgi:ATP phosphoribosyltransferase
LANPLSIGKSSDEKTIKVWRDIMKPLRIALTKGRLEKDTVDLFEEMGIDCSALRAKGRKLIFDLPDENIRIALAKAPDVITYVERGVCDIGVVGKDTIMEHQGSFYELMDLGFGKCRFVLASTKDKHFYEGYQHKVIATKYPAVARQFFQKKGLAVEIVKIEGSVELAPLLGLCDAIVDITETGNTLRENGLIEIETISDVSARLIVNVAGMKLRKKEIESLVERIQRSMEDSGND